MKTNSTVDQSTMARKDLLQITSKITAAHISNNPVALSELPQLINDIHQALATASNTDADVATDLKPAVPISQSVLPDYLVCLEDGKRLKMLKRHLKTAYDMTPEEYRARWGLGPDYPMVAPNYAKHRSRLAKKIGLGTLPRAGH